MENSYKIEDCSQEIIDTNDRTHEEFVKCSLKPHSMLWKSEHPKCIELKITDSPDLLNII
jgi:hypothetical protein